MSINKGAVIYVESPFQVLQAYELAEKLNKEKFKIILRLNNLKNNNEQMLELIKVLELKNIETFKNNAFSLSMMMLKLIFLSIRSKKIFIGDENSRVYKIIKYFLFSSVIYMDDGVATINSKNNNVPRFSIFNTKNIYLKNDFSQLSKFLNKKLIDSEKKIALVVGTKAIEEYILSEEDYFRFINFSIEHAENLEVYYWPHRGESTKTINHIKNHTKIRVVSADLPIEFVSIVTNARPEIIISMFSTALFSLNKIYPKASLIAIQMDNNCYLNRKESIMNMYKYFTNNTDIEIKKI